LELALDLMEVLQKGAAAPQELAKAPKLAQWAYGASAWLDCPYVVGGGGCAIYEDRPFLCRLYGNTPELACPHGPRFGRCPATY
jgi:Fe-S-cluster containining protein